MKLDVPYISQEIIEEGSERKWCGLASLAMVLNFHLNEKAPTLMNLLQKYGSEIEISGFAHKDFLRIGRDYGLKALRKSWWASPGDEPLIEKFKSEGWSEEELNFWKSSNLDEGLFFIKMCLGKNIPVIVSVSPEFSPSNSSHLVVIIGAEDNQLIIHDPYKRGESYKISEDEFKKLWLRQAMVFYL